VATLSNDVFETPRSNQVSHLSTDRPGEWRQERVSHGQFQANQISHGDEKPQIPGSTTANVGTRLGYSHPGTLFPLSALPIFKLSLMDSCDISREDLLIDGYFSHMFGPRDAEAYFSSLLMRKRQHIQWHSILPEGIFRAAAPSGLEPNQSNQEGWAIDYAIKYTGLVIPQQIWTPRKPHNEQRDLRYEQLGPPTFFVQKDGGSLGLSLIEAAAGNCSCLRGADVAHVGRSSHAQIRINVSSILTFVVRVRQGNMGFLVAWLSTP